VTTLRTLRAAGGADAVRDAITAAVAAHGYGRAAAVALGTSLDALRSAARRVGVPWPTRPAGRPRRQE
jgi:hypothetical protein